MRAPWMQAMPTPPQPNTTTDDPGVIFAVLSAAPTPVMTPQPTRDATSKGTSSSIFTTAWWGTTMCSANVPVPAMPWTGAPSSRKFGLAAESDGRAEMRLLAIDAEATATNTAGSTPR